jgi:2-phospho-L-lactate/phosphoenolpyruvate guanylyltransferase
MTDCRMTAPRNIHAVIPVKDTNEAKQRLTAVLSRAQRRELALAMLEDVLTALAAVTELAGMLVVTVDPAAAEIAARRGARIMREGACEGHTGAVAAAGRRLADDGMLALPGDIPLLQPEDVRHLLSAHRGDRAFTIVPAHDLRGSNAVICTPADAVPLRFGSDSFYPHLAAARSYGVEPEVVRLPRIGLDIDTPEDLALLLQSPASTRTHALLERWRVPLDCGASRELSA